MYAPILSLVWPYLVLRCKSKHAEGQIPPSRAVQACRGPAGCVRSAGPTMEPGNRVQASSERNVRRWLEKGWGAGCGAPLPGQPCALEVDLPSGQTRPLSLPFWLKAEGGMAIAFRAAGCLGLSAVTHSFPRSGFARVFRPRICILVVRFAQNFGKMWTKWIVRF